jgi:hypothetical protein
MNTTPDDITLALWLEDELEGAEHAAVEAWAATMPEQLRAREDARRWKAGLRAALPASEEPPYPEFFNARISAAINRLGDEAPAAAAPESAAPPRLGRFTIAWIMPAAAAAGMVLAFWLGSATGGKRAADSPVVYVPEAGINAEWVTTPANQPGVIVLSGLQAIPDATDFTQTVYLPLPREIDRTAGGGHAGGRDASTVQ